MVTNVYHLTLSHSISLMMEVDGIAETSGFVENFGLRPNSPGRNFNKNYFFVADNVVHLSLIHILTYKKKKKKIDSY